MSIRNRHGSVSAWACYCVAMLCELVSDLAELATLCLFVTPLGRVRGWLWERWMDAENLAADPDQRCCGVCDACVSEREGETL